MSIVQTPIHIIGASSSGTSFSYGNGQTGGILRRLGVWAGEWQLRGIRVWLTNSTTPRTFGSAQGSYREFTFEDGERMTQLSLWGNGAGTRSGALRFFTSRNRYFMHQMTSWGLRQEFPIDVASGLCVGVRGRHGEDIDALGFVFLLPIAQARMTNVRYPTLDFEAAGIQAMTVRDIRDENHDHHTPKEWSNSGSFTTTKSSSWSITAGIHVHASVSVTAGIPVIAEVQGQFGWALDVSSTWTTSTEETETTEWTRSAVLAPRQWLIFLVTTRRGQIALPYEATMEITLATGARFTYPLQGVYMGVNYMRLDIQTRTGSLDNAAAFAQIKNGDVQTHHELQAAHNKSTDYIYTRTSSQQHHAYGHSQDGARVLRATRVLLNDEPISSMKVIPANAGRGNDQIHEDSIFMPEEETVEHGNEPPAAQEELVAAAGELHLADYIA